MADETIAPDDVHPCPLLGLSVDSQVIRRQDLIDLGNAFKEALAPLGTIVDSMKVQNTRLEVVTAWLALIGFGAVTSLSLQLWSLSRIESAVQTLEANTSQLSELQRQVVAASTEVAKVRSTAQATEAKVTRVEARTQNAPKLELLPSPATSRARPGLVLRVLAPASSGQAISGGLVDLPLPVETVR